MCWAVSPQNMYGEVLPQYLRMGPLCGDRASKEVIKLKWDQQ